MHHAAAAAHGNTMTWTGAPHGGGGANGEEGRNAPGTRGGRTSSGHTHRTHACVFHLCVCVCVCVCV